MKSIDQILASLNQQAKEATDYAKWLESRDNNEKSIN